MKFTEKALLKTARELEEIIDPNVPVSEDWDLDKLAVWTTKAARLLDDDEVASLASSSQKIVEELRGEAGTEILNNKGIAKPKQKEEVVPKAKKKVDKKPAVKAKKKVDKVEERVAAKRKAEKEKKAARKAEKKPTPTAKKKPATKKEGVFSPQGARGGTAAYEVDLLMEKGTTAEKVHKVLAKKFPDKKCSQDLEASHHYLRTRAAQLKRAGFSYTVVAGTYKLGK